MEKILRTPESRFDQLPDYPFLPNYLEVEQGLRLHYLDEGSPKGPVVLLLHGEPSWSYLYRKMIPGLVKSGFRVLAPDLIGFGKSDKPADKSSYTYQKHTTWLKLFIEQLDLKDITLFCQDWGGLIGLRLIIILENRFSLVVASNTALPIGDPPMPDSFLKWQAFSQNSPEFDIGKVIDMGTLQKLDSEVIAAYNAPFPSEEYKSGARIFPTLVPTDTQDPESAINRQVWEKLKKWNKPFLTIFGDGDPIMKGVEQVFQKLVPGAVGQNHNVLNAGHFIQEEKGEELAQLVIEFYQSNTI